MLDRDRDRNLVFASRSRTSPRTFGFEAETDFRPALSEFAESPSGCQRRFGLLSLVRARFGLAGGRAGRREADSDKAKWRHAVPINAQILRRCAPHAEQLYREERKFCGFGLYFDGCHVATHGRLP